MAYSLEVNCSIQLSYRTIADWTGLEPVTSAVTGRHSNQLNYQAEQESAWWVKRGSNPRHSPCKGDALPAELFTQTLRLRILPTTLRESIKVWLGQPWFLQPKSVNQRPKLSTCQRPKLSSLATFLGAAFMVFEAIRVIAGFQDVAMMGNAIQ